MFSPFIKTFPACLVVNTDPSYKEGEHWLGMYFDRYKKCYFFDSFGNMPEYFGLLEYIDGFSSSMEYNEDQIQGELYLYYQYNPALNHRGPRDNYLFHQD
jgi:hypothetical protein